MREREREGEGYIYIYIYIYKIERGARGGRYIERDGEMERGRGRRRENKR